MPSSTVAAQHFLRLLCETAEQNKILRRWIPFAELKIADRFLGTRFKALVWSDLPAPVQLPKAQVATANNSSTYWVAITATFRLQRDHQYRL